MLLDIRTIIWLLAFSSLSTGLAMFLAADSFPEHVRGIQRWAWACFMNALGWTLIGLHGTIPDVFSIVVANTALAAAAIANFHSLLDFLQLRFSPRPLYFSLVFIAGALAYWAFSAPNMGACALVVSLSGALFSGLSGARLLFPRSRFEWPKGITQRAMICGFCSFSLLLIVRAVYCYFFPLTSHLFAPDWGHSLFFCGIFIHIVMLTVGFMLMCNEQIIGEWKHLATIDPLTGIWNRAAIEKLGYHCFEQAKRSGAPLSVLVGDIDYFKSINDTLGHEGGDRALQLVVDTLQGYLRAGDIMGRVGGEEFLCIAPNTSARDATHLAERLRLAVSHTPLENTGGAMSLTLSFGGAHITDSDPDLSALIRRADLALYRAKAEGRNRVVMDGNIAPPPHNDLVAA